MDQVMAASSDGTDHGALDDAMDRLLADHPSAFVGAVDDHGQFIPLPASLGTTHRPLRGLSAIYFVVPADRVAVIEAWERTKATGAARASAHLCTHPDPVVEFNFFDQRHRHGCVLVVLPVPDGVDPHAETGVAPPVRPRVTRMKKDPSAVVVEVDDAAERMLGWAREEIVGKRTLEYIHPDDHAAAVEVWMEMLGNPGLVQRARLRHLRSDGTWLWTEVHNHNLLDDPDGPWVLTEMFDISDEMSAHETVRNREQLLNRLAEALPTGILQVRPDRAVVYTNDRLHHIVGVPLAAWIDQQLSSVVPADRAALDEAVAAVLGGSDVDLEVHLRRPGDDDVRLCELNMRTLSEDDGTVTGAVINVADVTESALLRKELEVRATFDALTGCHNRASILSTLDAVLTPGSRPLAVVFIDLDGFKAVNDDLGHAAGDELLVVAADRLRGVTRDGDVVGRLGGDEFLLACPGVDDDEMAVELGERVAAALNRTAILAAGPVELRASVGVVHAVAGTVTADDLVARADTAMYQSKSGSDGRPVVCRL